MCDLTEFSQSSHRVGLADLTPGVLRLGALRLADSRRPASVAFPVAAGVGAALAFAPVAVSSLKAEEEVRLQFSWWPAPAKAGDKRLISSNKSAACLPD